MYIYHALINALSAHIIHINLDTIFYTHVEDRLPKRRALTGWRMQVTRSEYNTLYLEQVQTTLLSWAISTYRAQELRQSKSRRMSWAPRRSLTVCTVSVDVKQHWTTFQRTAMLTNDPFGGAQCQRDVSTPLSTACNFEAMKEFSLLSLSDTCVTFLCTPESVSRSGR